MNFYKDTKSFELVTILEKANLMNFFNRLKNFILFIFKFETYRFKMKTKINKSSNIQKIDLVIELFKEYFYLQQLINAYNLSIKGEFSYILINDIIICDIKYEDIKFNIEFNISNEANCIFLIDKDRGYNLTEKNIEIFKLTSSLDNLLNTLFCDIEQILLKLYKFYTKKEGIMYV